ncbi:MAG: flagellar export chaperone FlgN [Gammaproteobacteria bacterium]|nr:flagellar export chaperone FlgN [Gammaproteobacteria bacterium]
MAEQEQKNVQLAKLLNQQKLRLQQMLSLLGEELEAIKVRNGELLVQLIEKKELQLEAIRNADSAFNNDASIDVINHTPELKDLQREINELLEQCQTQNEVCYLAATQNQVAVEQVKNLLIGGSKNTTYNEKGLKSSSGSLSRGLKA